MKTEIKEINLGTICYNLSEPVYIDHSVGYEVAFDIIFELDKRNIEYKKILDFIKKSIKNGFISTQAMETDYDLGMFPEDEYKMFHAWLDKK